MGLLRSEERFWMVFIILLIYIAILFVYLFFLLNLIFIDNFKGIQIRDVYICFLMRTYLIFFYI